MKPNCYECKHRGDVPGSAHSCCKWGNNETGMLDLFHQNNWENVTKLEIRANPHGIRNGWFMWPINYDPTWLENCNGFEQKDNGRKAV